MDIQAFDIAVVLIAVAQALVVLLTWRRERDVKRLRERIDQQQLLLNEIRAWLKRDVIAKTRQDKPEREPVRGPTANKAPEPTITLKDLPDAVLTSTAEGELERLTRTGEIVLGPAIIGWPEPAITPQDLPDTLLPRAIKDETEEDAKKRLAEATNWLKQDQEKVREIVSVPHQPPKDE
jgi:hypothetical protein